MKYLVRNYQERFLKNLLNHFDNEDFCDVTLVCDDATFHVHKVVLASSCEFFNSMFRLNFYENKNNSIAIKDVKADLMENLLKFIYSGCIHITQDNVQDLLLIADQYGMCDLTSCCIKFLEKNMTTSNVVGMYLFSEQLNCEVLKKSSFSYMKKKFSEVIQSDEYLSLPFHVFMDYLSAPQLAVNSEKDVLNAVLSWLFHDIKEREPQAEEVLKMVKLSVLPYQYIQDICSTCSSVIVKNYFNKVTSEPFDSNYNSSICRSNRLMMDSSLDHSNSSSKIYFIGIPHIYYRTDQLHALMYYDVKEQEVKYISSVRQHSEDLGQLVASIDKRIYILGGMGNGMVEMLDVSEKKHQMLPQLPSRRAFGGACSVSNEIYLIGGSNSNNNINKKIDIFNTWTNTWRSLPFPEECTCVQHMGVLYWKGLIYIIGGEDQHGQIVNQCLTFNPISESFEEMSSMLTARTHFGISGFADYVYVSGGLDQGFNVLCTIERFSIKKGIWEKMNSLSISRFSHTMVTVLDKLFIIGGSSRILCGQGADSIKVMDTYNPIKNKCVRLYSPLFPDLSHPCAVVI